MKSSTASHTGPLSAICPPRECWPSAHIDHEKPSYVELENERTKTSLFLRYCAYLRFLSQSTFARLEYVLELVQTTAGQCDNESNSQSGTGGQQVVEQSRAEPRARKQSTSSYGRRSFILAPGPDLCFPFHLHGLWSRQLRRRSRREQYPTHGDHEK